MTVPRRTLTAISRTRGDGRTGGTARASKLLSHPAHELMADELYFGPFRFDRETQLVRREGALVPLPPRVTSVLRCLVDQPGELVSKRALLQEAWKDAYVTDTSLAEAVSLLRQALGDDPQRPTYVQTVHRRGYRFIAPVTSVPPPAPAAASAPRDGMVPPQPVATEASAPSRLRGDRVALRARWTAVGVAVSSVVFAIAVVAWWRTPAGGRDEGAVTRFVIPVSDEVMLDAVKPAVAISPDGRRIVYAARHPEPQLYVRALDDLDARPVAGTRGGSAPFFSPDGQSVGFIAHEALQKVAIEGGVPVRLCEVGELMGASWGDAAEIVFAQRTGLFRVSADGGRPEPLLAPAASRGDAGRWWPHVVPGSRAVLYTAWTAGPEGPRIELLSRDTGQVRTLVLGGSSAQYSPTGHLVYVRAGSLYSVPFDLDTQQLTGSAVRVLGGVSTNPGDGSAQFAFSHTGSLVYVSGTAAHVHVVLDWFADLRRRHVPAA